ncbi:MAG: hypothetical protein ABGZ49_07050 [Akkermansiaceae bacterium]
MKKLSALFLATGLLAPCLRAELESEFPLGLEAVTGVRSAYSYRGFDLAGSLLDFQFEGELVLQDNLSLNAGGWFGTEISDDFTEGTAFLDLRYDLHECSTVGTSATYHAYGSSLFENGLDVGAFVTWYAGEEWDLTAGVYRDFGADAWYANIEGGWSSRLSDEAYFGLSGGVSAVEHYYGRSGLNDFYGRASVTYNVNSQISLTPFLGWSIELEEADGDEFFGGLWFEVSF